MCRVKKFEPITIQPLQRIIAFVVGIAKYEVYQELKNPVRDSKAITDLLEAQNVEVFYVSDCGVKEFEEKFTSFEAAIKPGDTAFLYFAGHAVEFENSLRLIAKSNSSTKNIEADSLNLDKLLARSIARDPH